MLFFLIYKQLFINGDFIHKLVFFIEKCKNTD